MEATSAAPAAGVPPEHRMSLKPLLDAAAASAGFIVLIQLVGRAVMWGRFHSIGLPATQAISLQPLEVLLANGAAALLVAIALGLAAVTALLVIETLLRPRGVERQGRVVLLAVLELILLAAVLEQPASWAQRVAALSAGLVAGVVFWVLAERANTRRAVLALFMLIAAVGGVLAYVRNAGPPAKLPFVSVYLKDGSMTTGAYVALASDTVYLAPDSFNRTYGEISAIPRTEVKRISVTPPQEFEEAGHSSPKALFAGRRIKAPYGTVAPAVARYLASLSADPVWQYPPVSFVESAYYISRHPGMFFGPDTAPEIDPGRHVALERLVPGAHDYSGQPVQTDGVVVRTSALPGGADVATYRLVTLRAAGHPEFQAFCLHYGPKDVPVDAKVSVEGVIINAGTVASDEAHPIKGVFIQTAGNACGVRP
jgi:hypothetical protein